MESPATTATCHLVVMPYPGRGHINPMMSLCNLIYSKNPDILITFVVTEEWHHLLAGDPKPPNVRFSTLPNVIPSEHGRANDHRGFVEAVMTKMESPFEDLLHHLPAISCILTDGYMNWVIRVGNQRNIPVALLWTMSATLLSFFHHFDLLVKNNHFPVDLSERGNEIVDYIPGLPPTTLVNLPPIFRGTGNHSLQLALNSVSWIPKSQFILFNSVYELESQAIDFFKKELDCCCRVLAIGPSIPFFNIKHDDDDDDDDSEDYFQWLNSQPKASVLYISLGSFWSTSREQMDELVAGVRSSGVRYLWVSRGDASWWFKDDENHNGIIVPWCQQLRVLCHPSVGGFLTHCGWNSTTEAVYAGVPTLTFPIVWDQFPNSKQLVEDWKVGRRVKEDVGGENVVVSREEIGEIIRNFMDLDSDEGKEMRKRAKDLAEASRKAIGKGGSSDVSLDIFIEEITKVA